MSNTIVHNTGCRGEDLLYRQGRHGWQIICGGCSAQAAIDPAAPGAERLIALLGQTDPRIQHRTTCRNPLSVEESAARPVLLCRSCGRHGRIEQEPGPAAVPMVSSWRCREHIDTPVSWRGIGCLICDDRKAGRRAEKRQVAT